MLENEGATIPNHLKIMEKQPLMKMVDFHSLVIKMTRTPPHIMKRHQLSLTHYPVCTWEKILCTLLDVDETTLTHKSLSDIGLETSKTNLVVSTLGGLIASLMAQHQIIILYSRSRRLSQLLCSKRSLFMPWPALQRRTSRFGSSPLGRESLLWLQR